jgi:hypothetical protein
MKNFQTPLKISTFLEHVRLVPFFQFNIYSEPTLCPGLRVEANEASTLDSEPGHHVLAL